MMNKRGFIVIRFLLIGHLLLFTIFSLAQDYPRKEISLERLIDEVYPIQDLDINYEDLYENLAQILANPLDLNSVTSEQLRSLYILREEQLNAFLNYRKENGPFISLYELQSIAEFDEKTISTLLYFVVVKQGLLDKSFASRVLSNQNNYLVIRSERTLEQKKGYSPEADSSNRYAGSPNKLYTRFRTAQSNDFSFGFTLEKDPGEAITWKPSARQYGFDYISYHAQLLNRGKIKNVIVGDYQAQFGQGLIFGGGFGAGKGAETITTIRKSNIGFLPYTSLTESGFFRGTAVSYKLNPVLSVHTLLSSNRRNGRLQNDSLSDTSILLSSIASSGLHRTTDELAKRKQIEETNIGLVMSYSKNNIEAGVIFSQTNFSVPVTKVIRPYNQFNFTGNQNTNVGAFLNYSINNFTFFSEASQSVNHEKAIVAGALASLSAQLDFSLLYRHYAPDFYSFYGNALAENTQSQNESAMYWGWKYYFSKEYSLSGYIDLFQFPWLRYRGYSPSSGNEWLIRFNYQPSKNVFIFLQAREETKDRNLSSISTLYQTSQGSKINYWINCDYAISPTLSFKTRVQTSSYQLAQSVTHGFAIVQDVNVSYRQFSLSARYALFKTDNYDTRLYIYERDIWLGFSFQPYTGVGIRMYALLQYKLSNKVDLWLRWANTSYQNVETIGSGLEMINGSSKNDIKVQIRVRF
jgi:hypothetical protein